ncbi:MAG: 30S ribosomal protein S6 [Kiritimatiellia bacterium]
MRQYDALFIFPSALSEEAVGKLCERVENEITKQGGTITERQMLGKRSFARRLKKQESGWYVLIRFDADPAKIEQLKTRYRLIEDIFRVQIVKREKVPVVSAPVAAATEGPTDGES